MEDAAPLRALYRKLIEDHVYTVLEAEDGKRALQIAERFQGSIALLLTDVSLAKILVQQRPAIKVLFMSGYADDVVAGPDQRSCSRARTSSTSPSVRKRWSQNARTAGYAEAVRPCCLKPVSSAPCKGAGQQ